jgi:hypothetical protein
MEVVVGSVDKDGAIRDLCLVALSGFELYFSLQINVPCGE